MIGLALACWFATSSAVGSPAEDDPAVRAGRDWWSFRPVERPVPPTLTGEAATWVRGPIDAFVRTISVDRGLAPAPEADRATLIRRLTFDLVGLPPSPEEVEAFEADDRPDAYERLVDRLLASPRYGERQARAWLDLARYADSSGFELDTVRPDAWRYRDWVVEALNRDLPYDRFVALQLAADELAPDEPRQLAALGFLRCGPSVDNQKNDDLRMDELDDLVGATSSAFLGLTVACARCHDHMFDPIPRDDYRRLVAVFAPSVPADLPMATPEEVVTHRSASLAAGERADGFRREAMAIERAARDRLSAERRASLPELWRLALDSGDLSMLSKGDQVGLSAALAIHPDDVEQALTPAERSDHETLRSQAEAAEADRPPPLSRTPGVAESARSRPPDDEGVQPGPPRAVEGRLIDFPGPPPGASTSRRRSALAAWIASAANPLTARVEVNRIWQVHFGVGLVATPSDFGALGDPPTAPELLDWLAAEFVASGWSRKALHRRIVTSAIYRQASSTRSEGLACRPPLRRLDAEQLRDAILACSGSLDLKPGGPGVFPPIDPGAVRTGNLPRWPLDARDGPEVWRRSLYVFRMRSLPLPFLEVFDLPDGAQSCPRRDATTLPTQGLSLLNDPFVIEQARRFALRVAREAGPDPADRIDRAVRIATGRTPNRDRRRTILEFLDLQAARHADPSRAGTVDTQLAALADFCHVLFNTNAFLYVD